MPGPGVLPNSCPRERHDTARMSQASPNKAIAAYSLLCEVYSTTIRYNALEDAV